MKLIVAMMTVLVSVSAFAYPTGSFDCGTQGNTLNYDISSSGVSGLPLVTITSATVTHKGIGQITETTNDKGQKVEMVKLNLGARAAAITFVDGVSACTKN